ncbi:MAG TPA: carbohydrate kinase [Candidatus Intestinimonas stercorigallinarum]|nr:carbohydrate kinase [Candidatus Intestinimonas stercorigallinarum]
MPDITAIGEILIDLTQTGVNEAGVPVLAANPGGAPANVAVAAARLGAGAAFIGKVGADGLGAYLTHVLRENGVDLSGLRTGEAATTMAIVSVDASGERDFRFVRGADADLTCGEVDLDLVGRSRFLHFGSVSLTGGAARQTTLYAVEEARRRGVLVSYDPNYRQALWPSREEAVAWMRRPLPLVDVLKLSDEELPLLTGANDPREGTALLWERGIPLVLLTLGGRGACYRLGASFGRVEGVTTTVADTNGAGDTFLGAVLSRLCRRPAGPLEGLTAGELEEIVAFANRAAAKTCSRSGAIPAMPTLDEL